MSVINPSFGQEDSPAQQEAALDRLKFMMGLLPGGSPFGDAVQIQPPDVLDPHNIDLVAMRAATAQQEAANKFIAARQDIDVRFAMLQQAAAGLKAIGLPVTVNFQQKFAELIDDVLNLQATLRPTERTLP